MATPDETPPRASVAWRVAAAVVELDGQAAQAKAAGVSQRTLRRYLRHPVVQSAIRDLTRERLAVITDVLAKNARAVAETLCRLAKGGGEEDVDSGQVNACRWALQFAQSAYEALAFEERLTALEARHAAGEPTARPPLPEDRFQ